VDILNTLLAETDWSELDHAYGPASDAPFQLLALLSEDIEARSGAVAYLDVAILHQGTVYPATGPVARVVAAMLDDPRTTAPVENVLPWDASPRPLRLDLLTVLARVAESCMFDTGESLLADADGHEPVDAASGWGPRPDVRARNILACRAVLPEVFSALIPLFSSSDLRSRTKALEVATRLTDHPDLNGYQPAVVDLLETAAAESTDPACRASAARLLGIVGATPRSLLLDEHPGVRACAALAPALADDPTATEALLDALRTPAAVDHWFDEHLPGQEGWLRFDLIWAAVERVDDFEALLPAALAVLPLAGIFTLDKDLGSFLTAAFPRPVRPGDSLKPSQRAYLAAVLDREELWRGASTQPWFRRTGLPDDREACRALVEERLPTEIPE
jgi:hypothetical protein